MRRRPDSPAKNSAGQDENEKTGFSLNPVELAQARRHSLLQIFMMAGRSTVRRFRGWFSSWRGGRGKATGGRAGRSGGGRAAMKNRQQARRQARQEARLRRLIVLPIERSTVTRSTPLPRPRGPRHQP